MGKNHFYPEVRSNVHHVSSCVGVVDAGTGLYQFLSVKNSKGQNHTLRCLHDLLLVDVVRIA